MVKGKRKPVKELVSSLEDFNRVLILGCGGCVSICLAGGQKEANLLKPELETEFKLMNKPKQFDMYTIERQCNEKYFGDLNEIIADYDAALSMACGAGVQFLAECFPEKPVIPAINTTAIGIDRDIGVYEEKCRACGQCVLTYTGGICPVTRCAKGIFNGPCGGTNKGKCEVSDEINCAWNDIFERLKMQDRLDNILKFQERMQWQNQTPRTTIQDSYRNRYL